MIYLRLYFHSFKKKIGWLAPALVKLASNETPLLSGPLTNREMSWIAAILCIGALLGSFCFGYIISLVRHLSLGYLISFIGCDTFLYDFRLGRNEPFFYFLCHVWHSGC